MKAARSRRSRSGHPPRSKAWLAALAVGLTLACEPPGGPRERRVLAEFGIFYGGQVQERQELAFEVDGTRQTQGFRLQMPSAAREAVEVRWEVGMPGEGRRTPDSQGRRARPRKVELGQARWRPGETVFEQALPFAPGDPLGLWNIRVLVGRDVVLDRPFFVYDPAQRERYLRASRARDAGT